MRFYSDKVYTVKIDYSAEEISSIIEMKLTINPNNTYKFNSLTVINKLKTILMIVFFNDDGDDDVLLDVFHNLLIHIVHLFLQIQ